MDVVLGRRHGSGVWQGGAGDVVHGRGIVMAWARWWLNRRVDEPEAVAGTAKAEDASVAEDRRLKDSLVVDISLGFPAINTTKLMIYLSTFTLDSHHLQGIFSVVD